MNAGKPGKKFHSYGLIERRLYDRHTGCGGRYVPRKLVLLVFILVPYLWLYKHIITSGNLSSQVFMVLHTQNDISPYFRGLNISNHAESSDDRLVHLHRMCERLGLMGDPVRASVVDHILSDDKHRILYCNIPKVACTTWKTVLTNLSANYPEPMPPEGERLPVHSRNYLRNKNIRPLEDYYPSEIRYRLDNYYSFMVVRHPLERVASAFKDKMDLNDPITNNHWMLIHREIVQRYREGGNYTAELRNISALAYSPIGFQEFVRYALNHFPQDRHWRTFYESCLPCTIRYDKIIKMESMQEDANEVLEIMGLPPAQRKIPHFNSQGGNRSRYTYQGYLRTLNEEDMNKLMAVYDVDMKLFGYT